MARSNASNPVTGGVRRKRNRPPTMANRGSGTIVEYSSLGQVQGVTPGGYAVMSRDYVPGAVGPLVQSAGVRVVGNYSTAKFLPGTKIRWEPSVSFTTTGRIFAGFTDNPEVAAVISTAINNAFTTGLPADFLLVVNLVKGLGNVASWPVWQETELTVPSKLRRKMFDVNETYSNTDTNILDRSGQVFMFSAGEGLPANTTLGGFWYHDKVMVEGLRPALAT